MTFGYLGSEPRLKTSCGQRQTKDGFDRGSEPFEPWAAQADAERTCMRDIVDLRTRLKARV